MIINYLLLVVGSKLHIRKFRRIKTLKSCFIATSINFHFECKHCFVPEGNYEIIHKFKFQGFQTNIFAHQVSVIFVLC